MKLFMIVSIILAGLHTICPQSSLPGNVSDPMVPTLIDCRYIKYTPNFSESCRELRNRYDSDTFRKNFTCCLCINNGTSCYSAKGGFLLRNIVQSLTITGLINRIVVAGSAIITNLTDFIEKIVLLTCLDPSKADCDSSRNCTLGCNLFSAIYGPEEGPKRFNQYSKCCYCGKPLHGRCKNCYCAASTNYATVKGQLSYITADSKTKTLPGNKGIFFNFLTSITPA